MASYFVLFIAFSIIGGIIDAIYCSIEKRKLTHGTVIPLFSPMYGIGGIILILIFRHLQANFAIQIIVATFVLTMIELLGGLFCVHILKKRVWDYSRSRWNFQGHIDLLHSFYWLMLSALTGIILAYAGVI
ncbi:MAG: putative ABC transporter permease [archaeon]